MLSDMAFVNWINEAESHIRFANYAEFDNYYRGNYDDINLPDKVQKALGVDISIKANMCAPIVNIKVQYVLGGPVTIQASSDEASEQNISDAEDWLRNIYKNNKLVYLNMLKLVRIMSVKGDGFIKLALASEDDAVDDLEKDLKIRVINPRYCLPKYKDDDYEEMELCAVKSFTYDIQGNKVWRAQVWYPEDLQIWRLDSASIDEESNAAVDHEWHLEESLENELGFIPVIHFPNIVDDQAFGISDLHNVTTLQGALLKYLTDQAVTADYQAYKRIFVIGAATRQGMNWIISPGTVTEIPDPEAKVIEIDAADLEPFIKSVDETVDMMLQVSQTPQIALGKITGGIPSGYALKIHYQPLVAKCGETLAILKSGLRQLNSFLLKLGIEKESKPFADIEADVNFTPGLPIDQESMAKTHKLQIENRTMAVKTAMLEEGREDPEAETEQIASENFDVFPAERIGTETVRIRERLEAGAPLTAEPRPEAVSEREQAAARIPPGR